jgi:hypothetical protein
MSDNAVVLVSVILRHAGSIVAIAGAVYCMVKGVSGWGWLLFVAFLLGSFSLKASCTP